MSHLPPRAPFHRRVVHPAALAVGLSVLTGQAAGAGFALNESSAAAAGTAYAGRAAAAQDASAMASNPAAISSLNSAQWTAVGALVFPKGELSDYSATKNFGTVESVAGNSGEKFVGPVVVPGAFYSMPFDEKLSFGIGFYVPFGLHTDYNDGFIGRYLADRSEVKNFNIQPTVSYKVSDQLSVGVGVFAAYVDGVLTQRAPLTAGSSSPEAKSTVRGDDWHAGIKIGGLWDNGVTSVGVSWTSNVDFTLKGSAKLEAAGNTVAKADGHLKLKLPRLFEIGASHKLTPDWTLVAGALWTGWSSFKEIRVVADETFAVPGRPVINKGGTVSYVPENWKDVWSFSVGAHYQLDPQWLLRFGYAFDGSPVKDEYRTARIPDTDRNWLTIGARFTPSTPWVIDMAYGYLLPKTVKVDEESHGNIPLTYKGKYKMSAQIAMASMTYQY